ncbi:MAG: Dam family site-specific DNA-(adenine-N6)-methyltransferase [Methylobacterium mesophilicum]|nr:Dam family site-specific DNA-(adenine-N6)-methyltransferase [Methylobacterium mesophilicum]
MDQLQNTFSTSPIKWAGGKRWLISRYRDLLPHSYRRYIEPFFGGGSIFFALKPTTAVISDANTQLIGTYKAIRDTPTELYAKLAEHATKHSTEYYYALRAEIPLEALDRAARFLYLNRSCFNGLYRVNRQGQFNVPKGDKTAILLPTDNFQSTSRHLANAEILSADFEHVLSRATAGDFVYVDPPYTVKHNNNGFLKYNQHIFSWADQERLADAVRDAVSRGAQVAISNAAHESIHGLYANFSQINEVERASVIGGSLASRGTTTEYLIQAGYST